jgi:Carboxypeptidase regulatory-like domain
MKKLAVSLLFAVSAFGQTFGQISGLINDVSGFTIPGAKITITNPQTNFTRTVTSNSAGNYNFPDLPPGTYDVRAEMQGFQTEVRTSIELQVQQTARVDFKLNVGSVSDSVEVTASTPLFNTENATVGTVIEQKRIEDLPLNGRSFVSLIALSPNVVSGQTVSGGFASVRGGGGDRGQISVSIAGQRREFMYFSLDGINNSDVDFNVYAFLPSIDALQEFKVQTGVYSSEFGYEAAQVNVSTRSGTNAYHGTLFEFLRNNALDARPFAFTSRVPASAPFKWNQFGFTFGGPVQIPKLFNGKNRLFFMSNYEGFRLRNQGQQTVSVPSAAMRTGDFSQVLPSTVITDPLNGNTPFAGNIIPASRLNPTSIQLLQYYPVPNIAGAGLVNNYLALDNNVQNKDQFTQRIDFVENANSTWFGRYSWQDDGLVAPLLFENGSVQSTVVKQAMISNTRVLKPTLVNEFRFGYSGFSSSVLTQNAYKNDVISSLGIPNLLNPPPSGWGIPQVVILGFNTSSSGYLGDGLQGPFVTNDHTFQWIDGLSWTHGAHSFKFGTEIRRDRYNGAGNQTTRGQFVFQNQATGYGFADYMLGYIQRSSDTGLLAITQLRRTTQAYYVTDNWKVRPNLSIEAGLRYEYTAPWNMKGDSMSNLILPSVDFTPNSTQPHPYFGRDCAAYGQNSFYPPGSMVRFNPAIQVQCVNASSTTLIEPDYIDWAPRLGLAWSPSDKWTVRAGFGIFYNHDQGNYVFDAARNISAPQTSVSANVVTHNLTWQNIYGGVSNTCGVPSPPFICVSSPVPFANDPNQRTPYMAQYTLNIQRQLTKSSIVEVGYLGSQGHRLQTHMSYNNPVLGAASLASRSPYPEFANIQATMGIASSNYESGTVKFTQRLAAGFSALLSYTYSKSLDDSSGINPENGAVGAIRQPQTGYCVRCEYGLSDFDTRHRFVGSVLYELPFGPGKPFLHDGVVGKIAGSWQLNSIVTISTGFPVTIVDGVNRSNGNQNSDRPNATGAPASLSDPSTGEWFNIQAFQLQPIYTFGNVGRNTVTSPGIFAWDFSVLKNFNVTEHLNVQFRFECFNCANHPNFADPGQTLSANQLTAAGLPIPGTGTFGQITSTRPGIDMRKLQFGLKVVF